jgi:plastocyanin
MRFANLLIIKDLSTGIFLARDWIVTLCQEEEIMRSSLSLMFGFVLAIAGAFGMWSCGGGSSSGGVSPTPTPQTSSTIVVNIGTASGPNAFVPNPVQATPGQTVAFKNADSRTHHIVMDDGSADLGDLPTGAMSPTVTVKANNVGKFHCTIHATMVGAINGPVPDPPPCTGGPAYCD